MVQSAEGEVVDRWPVDDERRWLKEIEWPLEEQKIDLLRQCVNRQRPFGKIESQGEMARLFGLESTLRQQTEWVSPPRDLLRSGS